METRVPGFCCVETPMSRLIHPPPWSMITTPSKLRYGPAKRIVPDAGATTVEPRRVRRVNPRERTPFGATEPSPSTTGASAGSRYAS